MCLGWPYHSSTCMQKFPSCSSIITREPIKLDSGHGSHYQRDQQWHAQYTWKYCIVSFSQFPIWCYPHFLVRNHHSHDVHSHVHYATCQFMCLFGVLPDFNMNENWTGSWHGIWTLFTSGYALYFRISWRFEVLDLPLSCPNNNHYHHTQ